MLNTISFYVGRSLDGPECVYAQFLTADKVIKNWFVPFGCDTTQVILDWLMKGKLPDYN